MVQRARKGEGGGEGRGGEGMEGLPPGPQSGSGQSLRSIRFKKECWWVFFILNDIYLIFPKNPCSYSFIINLSSWHSILKFTEHMHP